MTPVTASPLLRLHAATDGSLLASVPEPLCVGRPGETFLFGGCAFAAGIEAMERLTGLPVIVASAQFAAKARPGEQLGFVPELTADGRVLRQARVALQVGSRPFAWMHGAFGRRNEPTLHQGEAMPVVPGVADCPVHSVARLLSSNVNNLFEFRLAAGQLPDREDWLGDGGQDLACWVSLRSGGFISRLVLPVIADCAAIALPGALGRPATGTSLDNAIRVVAEPECATVLAATRIEGIRDGVAHVTTRIFAPDGRLLAVAQQSLILRTRQPG